MNDRLGEIEERVRTLERRMDDLKKWKARLITLIGDEFEKSRERLMKKLREELLEELVDKDKKD